MTAVVSQQTIRELNLSRPILMIVYTVDQCLEEVRKMCTALPEYANGCLQIGLTILDDFITAAWRLYRSSNRIGLSLVYHTIIIVITNCPSLYSFHFSTAIHKSNSHLKLALMYRSMFLLNNEQFINEYIGEVEKGGGLAVPSSEWSKDDDVSRFWK
ncbi:unnamed protein product [Trichobilharzia regenti]|nr:unnamed protein product [Trichobilharzia regenti]